MRNVIATVALLASLLAGCGGPEPMVARSDQTSPHGGVIVPLPGEQGFVELLNGADAPPIARVRQTTIVAYLLQPDRKTAVASPPQEIAIKLDTQKTPNPIPLPLKLDTTDPAGSARYVSEVGPYEVDRGGGGGTVEVTLNGKPITVPFRGQP